MGVGIQVEHLNAWFGKTQALYDISMNVAANHATAIIGPSGCGKSTFVRCLNRMHETIPDALAARRVRMGDLDVYNGTSAVQIRRRIGMVFQKPNPFPTMSIYDNVAAGLKLNGFRDRRRLDEIVHRSLTYSALWDEVKDTMHKKSGASLSGGQQQRLCIARALAVEPQAILLDEPCSDLESISPNARLTSWHSISWPCNSPWRSICALFSRSPRLTPTSNESAIRQSTSPSG